MTGEGDKRHSKETPWRKRGGEVVILMRKSPKVQIQKSKNGGGVRNQRRDAEREAHCQTVGGSSKATTMVQSKHWGKDVWGESGKRKMKRLEVREKERRKERCSRKCSRKRTRAGVNHQKTINHVEKLHLDSIQSLPIFELLVTLSFSFASRTISYRPQGTVVLSEAPSHLPSGLTAPTNR